MNSTQALAEYALGMGILTAMLYPLAYLTPPDFLSCADQKKAYALLFDTNNPGIPRAQLAAQQALYLAGAPQVELVGVNA